MLKNITITLGFIIIWGCVGGFDWAIDYIDCIQYNGDLINQLKEAENFIHDLSNKAIINDLIIDNYKKEVLDWTNKYNSLKDDLDLTKHSLNMANQALNNITAEGQIFDLDDYE